MSYDQEIELINFITKFKNKHRIHGMICVGITDMEHIVGDPEDMTRFLSKKKLLDISIDDHVRDSLEREFEADFKENLYTLPPKGIYNLIDTDIIPELMELYLDGDAD